MEEIETFVHIAPIIILGLSIVMPMLIISSYYILKILEDMIV